MAGHISTWISMICLNQFRQYIRMITKSKGKYFVALFSFYLPGI